MTKRELNSLIKIVDGITEHPDLTEAVSAAVRSVLPDVLHAVIQQLHDGDRISIYVPKQDPVRKRHAKIKKMLDDGISISEIAKQNSITRRTVYNIRSDYSKEKSHDK